MKKLIAAIAAAGVLVAGAFVASTVATNPADAQVQDSVTEQQDATPQQERPDRGAIFDEVLGPEHVDQSFEVRWIFRFIERLRREPDALRDVFARRPLHPARRPDPLSRS